MREVLEMDTLTVSCGCGISANSFTLPALSPSLAQTNLEVVPEARWQEVPHVNEVLENEIKKDLC